MADARKETDGPEPGSASGFDVTLLPDWDNDFIIDDDFAAFTKALAAPETSPSTEDLTAPPSQGRAFFSALSDWRPIHQRVRRRRKNKAPPRRGKDETREGFVYALLKWPLLLVVLGWLIFLSIAYVLTRFYIYLYEYIFTWRGYRKRLRHDLQHARSYRDWIGSARKLDDYLDNGSWRKKQAYAYYDSRTVARVHQQMVALRKTAESDERALLQGQSTGDRSAVEDLRTLVEACLKHNFAGFENPKLYSETYYGTKDLVQDFTDEAEASLSFLLQTTQLDADNKWALFKHLGSNFGRMALCLSGGATFAFYHFGVAKALLDANLLPEVITGTSGGALVAALLGTRTDEELTSLLVPALAHRLTACEEDMSVWLRRWYTTGARFDSLQWAKKCAWMTRGSMTFKEAYQRTGRTLNGTCVPADPHSPTILANYITAPDCVIWSAVLASAAVPGILNPVVLMKKNKDGSLSPYSFGHRWKDGSLRTDIPLKALNLHFNVRFSIVSQVNPHINIFFFSSRGAVGTPVQHRRGRGWRGGFVGSAMEQYLKLDLQKWLKVLRHLELLPRPLGQDWSELWLQRFDGTITIWPKSIPSDFLYILSDPTPQRLARMIHVGQQSVFSKLKFIGNRAKLERIIQQGRRQFRPRVNNGPYNVFSDDEGNRLLKGANGGTEEGNSYPVSGSESSSSAVNSSPGSPMHLPLAFTFPRPHPSKVNTAAATIVTHARKQNGVESPSLARRFSGWLSSLSSKTPKRARTGPSRARSAKYTHDRAYSMFELGAPGDDGTLAKFRREPQRQGSNIQSATHMTGDVEWEDDESDEEEVGKSGTRLLDLED